MGNIEFPDAWMNTDAMTAKDNIAVNTMSILQLAKDFLCGTPCDLLKSSSMWQFQFGVVTCLKIIITAYLTLIILFSKLDNFNHDTAVDRVWH